MAVAAVLVGDMLALLAHDGGSTARSAASQDEAVSEASAGVQSLPAQGSTTTTARKLTRSASSSKGSSATSTTTTTTTAAEKASPTRSNSGAYTFEVTLEPLCVRVGQPLTVTIKVERHVAVGVIAAYADGDTHESMWGQTSPDNGVVVRTWLAPPAPGPAKLLTGATKEDGTSGGTTLDFYVMKVGESCPYE